MENDVAWIELGEGADARRIAVRRRAGKSPGLVWLGGFMSDMQGTKAQALDAFAAERGQAIVRFDYSGHGESSGAFADGTIGSWLEDALAVFDACCRGPQILVGSSMGGWMALLLVQALRRRAAPGEASVAGLVLIAPAVDFTEALMWKRFPPEVKQAIETTGRFEQPTDYDTGPYVITKQLIEEGRNHLLLGGLIETGCPVRIVQGVKDPDVPWQHANALVARLAQDDVVLTLIKDGDHRLSRPEDISRILGAVAEMVETVAATP
ncbi:alpha/beta hydrolase [Rhodoplanes sp. SY1]|uniref:alpha/beta hydrolase n=1 Tax=Rhodoplanes sp. SY1 TaxID=3166646 RepID=UPI0038B4776D